MSWKPLLHHKAPLSLTKSSVTVCKGPYPCCFVHPDLTRWFPGFPYSACVVYCLNRVSGGVSWLDYRVSLVH